MKISWLAPRVSFFPAVHLALDASLARSVHEFDEVKLELRRLVRVVVVACAGI